MCAIEFNFSALHLAATQRCFAHGRLMFFCGAEQKAVIQLRIYVKSSYRYALRIGLFVRCARHFVFTFVLFGILRASGNTRRTKCDNMAALPLDGILVPLSIACRILWNIVLSCSKESTQYLLTFSLIMHSKSSCDGEPNTPKMWFNWSK